MCTIYLLYELVIETKALQKRLVE